MDSGTFRCLFLTCSNRCLPRRRELALAAKNCRPVRFGHYEGVDGREAAIRCAAHRQEHVAAYLRRTTLVPVPTSGQGVDEPGDGLWFGSDFARLLGKAYGIESAELLKRHTPVEKSSDGGRRELRRHVNSIEAQMAPDLGEVVLVDDWVTSGATICASAVALWRVNPHLEIKGLAVAYVPAPGEKAFFDFAMREYRWSCLEDKPHNYLVENAIIRRCLIRTDT